MVTTTRSTRAAFVAILTGAAALLPSTAGASNPQHTDPLADVAQVSGMAPIVCPLEGDSSFIDSWGASRSGGRRHEGVDMIADRGTPVIAAQAGTAEFKRNRLGGNAVWITTGTGDKFYYAHLDSFEGSSRSVAQGEVIGYVGSTGNAKGPHLHFETHFGGSVGNPYDATFEACIQPTIDALAELEATRRAMPATPAPGATDSALVAYRTLDLLAAEQ